MAGKVNLFPSAFDALYSEEFVLFEGKEAKNDSIAQALIKLKFEGYLNQHLLKRLLQRAEWEAAP
ncbi:hypothetical protein [Porphyromonas circumdentaria]|uniref:hypothetical protein n=1 Tax=Porphyromonas circumdentaria TaxID=29524 RepID=UPI00135649E5|nr:hypothetical protein [Porphyromonas circumdentaria]MBB6275467.1 hypothetical protein [Porphyromonas circumdentaria]MDO4722612.1 hypothetical protein [Porphyromonas circumdentaria]